MTYQTKSRGVRDPADLRITRPTSQTGALYARLENFLKGELARSLGLMVTFDFDLPVKGGKSRMERMIPSRYSTVRSLCIDGEHASKTLCWREGRRVDASMAFSGCFQALTSAFAPLPHL